VKGDTIIQHRLGIGTETPIFALDAHDNVYIRQEVTTCNLFLSNITSVNPFYNIAGVPTKTYFQVAPARIFSQVTDSTTNVFDITIDGIYTGTPDKADVYINGYRMGYHSTSNKDFDLTYLLDYAAATTTYKVTLETTAQYGDIVDITIWPQHAISETLQFPGYVTQTLTQLFYTQDPIRSNLYYTDGSVGIGTTYPVSSLSVTGTFTTEGDILPLSNITFDLGTASTPFRDAYISGTSIHLDTTTVQQTNRIPSVRAF